MSLSKQAEQADVNQLGELRQLTLIIPTYNRPHYLSRLLNYYAKKNTQLRFLILDSSDDQTKELNKQTLKVLGERGRIVDFPLGNPPKIKFTEGIKHVETSYCAFCADDDLVFVDALGEALTFLQANSDYVCVDGIYLNFQSINEDINLTIEYASNSIDSKDSGARVFKRYQKYESLFYGVFRKNDMLNIFNALKINQSYHFQELFQTTAALLIGKSHRLPIFYAARQSCPSAEENRERWQTYYWFADNPKEFIDHYCVYREALWDFYQTYSTEKKYDKDGFLKVMDIAHAVFFSAGCPPGYFHSALQQIWPDDVFQQPSSLNDVCSQLKNPRRVWLEKKVQRVSDLLPKIFSSLYWLGSIRKLEGQALKKTKTKWNCKLNSKLKWMARVDKFQSAYNELCQYLG